MKIYIDFDGTLFNTDKYTEDFMNILNDYGIDKALYNEVNNVICGNSRLFNINVIIDYFVTKHNINNSLKEKINNLLNDSYVYSDVIECLNILINEGYELYLLTYGDGEFQKLKINASNLSKYFKEIIITEKDKSKLDIDYENSIFIDNNPFEIEKFNNSNGKILIRIRRDNDKFANIPCNISNVIQCCDFNQIIDFLKGGFINE